VQLCDKDLGSCKTLAGPSTSRVLQCLVDPNKPARIYALVIGSKVFHSDDGAPNWELGVGGL